MLRRRFAWLVMVLTGLALFIAACSDSKVQPPVVTQPGSLEIIVEGIPEAKIIVAAGGEEIFQGVVQKSQIIKNLKPGEYKVDGMPDEGCIDPTPTSVVIKSEETTTVKMVYIPLDNSTPATPVKELKIEAVLDDAGKALPGKKEINEVKDVMLYAAQTEEPVCVMVNATDALGKPVKGAQLAVNISDGSGLDDRVAILRGCTETATTQTIETAAFRDSIFTDEKGQASFTLYAAYGKPEEVKYLLAEQPAKVVIAAENEDKTLALTEFKTFFFNLSHLYFNETYTGKRVGASFQESNSFDPAGLNAFGVEVGLFTKQPQEKLTIRSVGYLRFEVIEELNKAGKSADVVHFEGCDDGITVGLNDVCKKDFDGLIDLVPNAGIGLKDLPIQATVKATLHVKVQLGEQTYWFDLKDFQVTKRWFGSYLSIDKVVDHHVLTWAGPEHHLYEAVKPNNLSDYTLKASDDPAITPASVFTASYTITVKNEGSEPVYDLTIADALPAELGVMKSTLKPGGATYDAINHVITWNWLAVPEPKFDKLMPGETITASIEVYLRQKPGFCMDPEDVLASRTYQIQPIGKESLGTFCYEDPYALVNGKEAEDVTATFYTGTTMRDGGFQVKVDFAGQMHKPQVIIQAVRPLFAIDKVMLDPKRALDVGEVAYFDINIANTHRVRYDALETSYPEEFKGPRFNPYGRNVQVKDVFDTGLDFVSSSALKLAGTEYSASFIPDKGVLWQTVPLMAYRATGTAMLALRANLPSVVDMKLTPAPSVGVLCIPEEDLWYNCAFLDADNLNQPETEPWNGDMDWTQYGRRPWDAEPLHHSMHENLRYGLRDCEGIKVLPPPGEPWIEFDSESEYSSSDPNVATELPGVKEGDTYYYYFTITNTGEAVAKGIDVEVHMNCTASPAIFTADSSKHLLWYSADAGATWTFVADADTAGTVGGQCVVTFTNHDLSYGSPEPVFLYAVEAKAVDSGDVHVTALATYDNASLQIPQLPFDVEEDTSIAP